MLVRAMIAAALLLAVATPTVAQIAGGLQPGWIADDRTGCRVWNRDPKPNEFVTWSGVCQRGLAQGGGVLQWFVNDRASDRYEGEMRAGKENGRGVYFWADGGRYDGERRDGLRSGRGVDVWANGNRYEGEWRDDKPNGHGVYSWPNGDRYDGEFRDGRQRGHGVFIWANGDRYDGEWNGDKADGWGSLRTADGTFNGQWSNGCYLEGFRRRAIGVDLGSCP